jgi:putative hydrolase of the HAD superfamily
MAPNIKAVLFDFGGVIAEEGFKNGLEAIGARHGIKNMFEIADALIYETGYVIGKASERDFWRALRERTGITGSDDELREEILKRFTLRDGVLKTVDWIRSNGITAAILSDQTNWLDEIGVKTPFLHHFDRVFNSYDMGKGKRDPSLFEDVCRALKIRPDGALFIDDKLENVRRALDMGLKAIHYRDMDSFDRELRFYLSL